MSFLNDSDTLDAQRTVPPSATPTPVTLPSAPQADWLDRHPTVTTLLSLADPQIAHVFANKAAQKAENEYRAAELRLRTEALLDKQKEEARLLGEAQDRHAEAVEKRKEAALRAMGAGGTTNQKDTIELLKGAPGTDITPAQDAYTAMSATGFGAPASKPQPPTEGTGFGVPAALANPDNAPGPETPFSTTIPAKPETLTYRGSPEEQATVARNQATLNDADTPDIVKAFIKSNPTKEVPYQLYTTAQADETRRQIADVTNDFKQKTLDIQMAAAEGRLTHAAAVLQMQQANAELARQLGELKLTTAKQALEDKKTANESSRSSVNSLATELLNDPQLSKSVGFIDGRTPNVLPSAVDFQNRLERLKSLLSLENRQSMKGQGAISDFESKMLEKSATSLDPRADEATFKKELQRIIDATKSADSKSGGKPETKVFTQGPYKGRTGVKQADGTWLIQ